MGIEFLQLEPTLLPVIRILFPQTQHIVHTSAEARAFRNHFGSLAHDGRNIVTHIGIGIKGADKDASIPAVAVVHYVTYPVGKSRSLDRLSRAEHSDEVGFNLEVNIIGVRIVLPISGLRSRATVEYVVARSLIGVPEIVVGIGETVCIFLHRRINSHIAHHFKESEVHIDIIKQARIGDEGVIDIVVIPYHRLSVRNEAAFVLEFRRTTVGASYGLGEPSAADFVHQDIF